MESNRSVERALSILSAFNHRNRTLSLVELSRIVDIPRVTVLRIAATLCKHGFLFQEPDTRRYQLGLKLFELGGAVHSSLSLKKAAHPHLRLLCDGLNETAFLAVLHDDELIYIAKQEDSTQPLKFASAAGLRRLPHFGAFGQALMAYLPDEEIERILQKHPLAAFTKKSITTKPAFMETLRKVEQQDIAVEEGTVHGGIGAVAAPVRDSSGKVVAAAGVGFISSFRKKKGLHHAISLVAQAAADISRDLGYLAAGSRQG